MYMHMHPATSLCSFLAQTMLQAGPAKAARQGTACAWQPWQDGSTARAHTLLCTAACLWLGSEINDPALLPHASHTLLLSTAMPDSSQYLWCDQDSLTQCLSGGQWLAKYLEQRGGQVLQACVKP
jgi:hypothetical protein